MMPVESDNGVQLSIAGKKVVVHASSSSNAPIVYLNGHEDDIGATWQALRELEAPDFTLVNISGLDWNSDMTPWVADPIVSSGGAFLGGADRYIDVLVHQIIPAVESRLEQKPSWRGLAGYSLSGLFAIYAPYRTDAFSRVASMSGSMWFPGFCEYAESHEMKGIPDAIYMSLGSKERWAKNPIVKTVQDQTEKLFEMFRAMGTDCTFELNPGGHFSNVNGRTAKGIKWILER
ncbi:MAG: alpha/beta hydrolase [Coriobacteriales bacterium]|jgi:predicted alpha/beta superfamily hydrolase